MTDKMLCDYVMVNEPCFRRFILGRSPEKSNSMGSFHKGVEVAIGCDKCAIEGRRRS